METPWGSWEILGEGANFKIKKLVINPTHRLSMQMHHKRSEYWVVVSGRGVLSTQWPEAGNLQYNSLMVAGDHLLIPVGQCHRIEALAAKDDVPLIIIETQVGVCDENDIERTEDDYGRILFTTCP